MENQLVRMLLRIVSQVVWPHNRRILLAADLIGIPEGIDRVASMDIQAFATDLEEKLRERCIKSRNAFENAMRSIRSARASVDMLDRIEVTNYGAQMPLKQMATITAPEPRLLVVTPFNPQKDVMMEIEKAIQNGNLGLQPQNDGQVIRLTLPELSMERRQELVKQLDARLEELKIALRNIRRDGNQEVRKQKEIPEDEARTFETRIQKIIDQQISEAQNLYEQKSQAILKV